MITVKIENEYYIKPQSVQFSRSVMSDSLWPHGLQHARPPVYNQLSELAQTHVDIMFCPRGHKRVGYDLATKQHSYIGYPDFYFT